MKNAIKYFIEIKNILQEVSKVFILSDFDGTLIPLIRYPHPISFPESIRNLLQEIARNKAFTLGIISGRPLATLKKIVDIPHLIYSGNQGYEIETSQGIFIHPTVKNLYNHIILLNNHLLKAFQNCCGIQIENKGIVLTVYYHDSIEYTDDSLQVFLTHLLKSHHINHLFSIMPGNKCYEIKPLYEWHKGKALSYIIHQEIIDNPTLSYRALYLGDDYGDEYAFQEVKKREGIGIRVGEPSVKSCAEYYLSSPQEVHTFLTLLIQ